MIGILIWGLLLFLIAVWSMHNNEKRNARARQKVTVRKFSVPSLGMVLFRRFLHRKSIWLSLLCILVLSMSIIKVEQNSQAQIRVAVYDASGAFAELLCAYDGLAQFEMYESDMKVQDAVQKGKVECGYILPATLTDEMAAQEAKREIIVYQDADAVAVPVVNEILFERIFRQVSFTWFVDYITQMKVVGQTEMDAEYVKAVVADCFHKEIEDGTTFRFEVQRLNTESRVPENQQTKRTIYPSYLIAVIAVVLCTLQGILQVIMDFRKQNFYRQNRLAVSAFTLFYPVLLGILCAFLILINSY